MAFASSDKAFSNFGIHIKEEERHTALADAFATAQLFTQLIHSQTGKTNQQRNLNGNFQLPHTVGDSAIN